VSSTSVSRLRPLAALAIAAVIAVCVCSGIDVNGLLCVAPALALAALLFARRYPGERLLRALARRRRGRRLRPAAVGLALALTRAHVPRGALLMGFALAVRPPPTPLAS
jgi:hypothetical protein